MVRVLIGNRYGRMMISMGFGGGKNCWRILRTGLLQEHLLNKE
jgi:Fe2+ transport system protein FeoA